MGNLGAAQAVGHQNDGLPARCHGAVQHGQPGLDIRSVPVCLLDGPRIGDVTLPVRLPMLFAGSAEPRHHQKAELDHVSIIRISGIDRRNIVRPTYAPVVIVTCLVSDPEGV